MKEFTENLKHTVKQIHSSLGVSRPEFLELLGLSEKEYVRIERGQKEFGITNLISLCDEVDISVSRLFDGDIDYATMVKRFLGDKLILPEKYQVPDHKLARARTVLGVWEYLVSLHGETFARTVLRNIQIRPECFSEPQDFISAYLVTDLFKELTKMGIHKQNLREMGKHAFIVNSRTPVGTALSLARNPSEVYQILHEDIVNEHYDHLFYYKLTKLSEREATIETIPRWDMQRVERGKGTVIGDRELCLYKQGVYASFLGHINRGSPRILESACLYHGDEKCVYHIHLT